MLSIQDYAAVSGPTITIGLYALKMLRDSRIKREEQHEENQQKLRTIELDVLAIKTSVSPIVRWWNGGPGEDR